MPLTKLLKNGWKGLEVESNNLKNQKKGLTKLRMFFNKPSVKKKDISLCIKWVKKPSKAKFVSKHDLRMGTVFRYNKVMAFKKIEALNTYINQIQIKYYGDDVNHIWQLVENTDLS